MRLTTRLCGSVRRTRWAVSLALAAVTVITAFAMAAPAEAAVINRWTAVQPTGTVGTNIPLVVRGSSPVDAYPLSASTLKLYIDGELVPRTSYTASVLRSSIYVYYVVSPPLSDGLRAFRVEVADTSGAISMRMWTAFVAQAPTATWTAPAAGATVASGSPAITLALSDNTPATTFTVTGQVRSGSATGPVVATFGGSDLPAGTASFTPSAELSPGTWFATATVADAAGNTRQLTGTAARSFSTVVPPAMSILGECADCHAAIVTAHPAPASTDCGVCHPDKVDDHMQGTEDCVDCHVAGGAAMVPHGATVAVRSQCTDCHNTARPEVVQHTPASVDPEHASSCMGCHTESLLTRHSLTPEGSSYALQCDACHASTDPAVLAAIAAGDTSCGACHTGHVEQHEVTVSAGCASDGCHSGTNLVPIHGDSCAACHESARQVVIDSIAAGSRTCESCHTAIGVDYHLNAAAAHASPTTTSCFGAGCHPASRDLAAVHEIYAGPGTVNPQYANACALCHANPAVDVSTSGARCTPACHSISTHSGYAAGHTITAASAACTVCHTGWLEGVHGFTGSNWAVCDTCHLDPGTGLKTADCASCHVDVDHLSLHDAPVSEGCAGAGCHTGTNLSPIHDSNCDGCHKSVSPTVIAAIAAGDKSCTACHTTVGVDYHLNMTVAHTAPVSDYESCGGCHHGWGSSPIKGPDVLRHSGGCVTCHNATLDLTDKTAHCGSCHLTEGSGTPPESFHRETDLFHTATTAASESCGRCHGTNVRELHTVTTSCSTCHVTRSCAECHTPHSPMGGALMVGVECARCHPTQGTDYHVTFATDHTYAAMDPGCQAVGCHSASLVDAHAAFVGPTGRYPQYEDTCALCHLNEDAERIPGDATAACSSCHAAVDHESVHAATIPEDCSGCHAGTSLTGIHATGGCGVCHGSADPAVADAIASSNVACSACHSIQPHPDTQSTHTGVMTSGVMSVFDSHYGYSPLQWEVSCDLCHGTTELLPLHGNDCALCHNGTKPAESFTTWNKSCSQGACHPTIVHPQADPYHNGYDCEAACHEQDWSVYYETCEWCHDPIATLAPVTSSDAVAAYVGVAAIHLSTQAGATTYYRLDGGEAIAGTTITVTAPASGIADHTLEFWSVSSGGIEEFPHKTADFTVAADTQPPVTTSNALTAYVGPVTITLSPSDNNSQPVAGTYWKLDGGGQTSGTTIAVPQPPSGTVSHTLEFWSVDASGNEELPHKVVEFTVEADLTAPTGSITIAGGADYTVSYYVNLSVPAEDPGGSGLWTMRFSNNGVSWSDWEGYASTRYGWNIGSTNGSKTVYVQFRDWAGNIATYSDTIVYDNTAPAGSISINSGAASTAIWAVTLTLSASDAGSGIYGMRFSNNQSTWTDWEPFATTKDWTLAAGGGNRYAYVEFRDNAGNTRRYSDWITVIPDTIPPTGSVSINGNAATTSSVNVTLALSASDTGGASVGAMQFSNDNVTWSDWEPYATSKDWVLEAVDGLKTVYVRYRDTAGNVSSAYSDTITLTTGDADPPTGSIVINDGAESVTTPSVILTLSASDTGGSGLAEMRFSNDNATWTGWEAYASSKSWVLASGAGTRTAYVQFRDGAGNVSAAYSDDITVSLAGTSTLAFEWWSYGYAELHVEDEYGTILQSTIVEGSSLNWYVPVPSGARYYMVCDYYEDWEYDTDGGGYGKWSDDPSINPDGVLSPGETVTWYY